MNRLKYWQKFLLIGVVFVQLISLSLYLLMTAYDREIVITKQQLKQIQDVSARQNEAEPADSARTEALTEPLQERIDELQRLKWLVLIVSLVVLGFLIYLFYTFYLSVNRTVYALKEAARQAIKGNLTTRVDIHTKDELAQVSAAFNKMIDAFRNMLEQREKDKQQIEHLAYHDSLTGLANRVLAYDRLQAVLESARRTGRSFAVMFIDIDRFKKINDTLGHDAGDRLLQAVAHRLGECLTDEDTLARMGGDEFLLTLPQANTSEKARKMAENIFHQLQRPISIQEREWFIALSIGISLYPRDGRDLSTLVKAADTAMYYAKNAGKNVYRFYEHSMNKRHDERLQLEASLHHALERKEFMLEYQPRLDLVSGKVTGTEALIRWVRPEVGTVSPGAFIPLAEENGAINEIGHWVLAEACQQIRKWQRQGLPPFVVSVNISAVQFEQEQFVELVGQTIRKYGIDASWLELELTERVVMNKAEYTIEKLKQLKQLGLRISIDDFGTGFSSLNYLKYFPIDGLKIDRSFIKDIPHGQKDLAITKTIIALGRRLNLRVIAEGVETEAQYQFLHARRCNEVQGFLISPPLSAADAGTFVHRAGVV